MVKVWLGLDRNISLLQSPVFVYPSITTICRPILKENVSLHCIYTALHHHLCSCQEPKICKMNNVNIIHPTN